MKPDDKSNRCPIDRHQLRGNFKICDECSRLTRVRLAEIPRMYVEAGAYLEPGRGGFGSSGSERTIGVNLAALGFRQAAEILGKFEAWERTVRVLALGQAEFDEQDQVVRVGTIEERVGGVCSFLLVHSRWLSECEGAGYWFKEVADIHGQGEAATRRFAEKLTKIRCPTSLEVWITQDEIGYENCGAWLTLGKDPMDLVKCKRCDRDWTSLRLVAVAMSTPGIEVWMDSETIGKLLGVTSNHVAKLAKNGDAKIRGRRRNELYDLMEISILREKTRHAE